MEKETKKMKVDLKDKVAVVTGAAGTIGSVTARMLAENGALVFLNDLDAQRVSAVTEGICAAGLSAFAVQGDVCREADMQTLIKEALERFGRIDILVNNAGVNVGNEHRKPAWEYDLGAWRRVVDICIDSVYHCCKYALPAMIQNGGGKVVNIGSVAGWMAPLRLQCAYSAAKAGISNLTRSMAIDYAKHHINVNAVVPGSIINEQIRAAIYSDPHKHKSMYEHIPMGASGEPEDIASAVMFLVSTDAKYITGCTINVDGGWAAGYAFDDQNG